MKCVRCQYENEAGAKFCQECAAPLTRICTNCGRPLPPTAKFCPDCAYPIEVALAAAAINRFGSPQSYTPQHLAEKILTSKSALEGERKQVTVLFADMKSSLELLADRDPEYARSVLDPVLTLMMEAVHRYEGTVNQVMGDGIMALFGAPLAHEDHALRACYAALDILASLDPALKVRIGLNSGAVIVRAIRSDLRMDYTAVGETTHLAARMEQLASSNTVYLTESTYRLVKTVVSVEPLGPIAVKGLANPLPVFVLRGALRPAEVARLRSTRHRTRFVGRERELEVLQRALDGSERGDVRVVGITGEAGIGKSRLCFEFAEHCRSRSFSVWHIGATLHGRAMPFALLLDFLRQYFAISDEDDASTARGKVEARLRDAGRQESDDLPLLLDLLGVPAKDTVWSVDPNLRRQALCDTLKHLVWVDSRRQFSVFVFEDLQWLDSGSEMLLEALVEAVRGTPAMLIVTFRPPYHAVWMNRSYYEQLSLSALPRDAAVAVVAGLLGADPSVRVASRQVLDRAEGNVFFIEELIRSLVESGRLVGGPGAYTWLEASAELELPATVTAVLASRIDRLSDADKETLQTAAVIGREFSGGVLAAVTNVSGDVVRAALSRLAATEFLVEKPGTGDEVYAFKHPLTQEVAYQSQILDRRRRLHAAVARALQTVHRDRLDELAGLLAFHQEAAGDLRAAAASAVRAAKWIGLRSPAAAIGYWAKARSLLKPHAQDPETWATQLMACGQLLNLGWRQGIAATEAAEYFDEAASLARRLNDFVSYALVVSAYGRILVGRGSADEYVRQVEIARQVAEQTRSGSLQVTMLASLCQAKRMAGRLGEALTAGDTALARIQEVRSPDTRMPGFNPRLWLLGLRAQCLMYLGRFDDATRELDTFLAGLNDTIDLALQVMPRIAYVEMAALTGDAELAARHTAAATELSARSGSPYLQVHALAAQGIALRLAGDHAKAAGLFEEALALAHETNSGLEYEARVLCELADARVQLNLLPLALETAAAAVDTAQQRHARVTECQAQLVLAGAHLTHPDAAGVETARQTLERAEQLIAETGALAYKPDAQRLRLRLAALTAGRR
jgi:class 3 adenylate cyclase/tetratricopeptide (TPR) repeat protein